MKDLIVFDIDGSLTESKAVLDPEMADLLSKLLAKKKVAVISGAGYPQFQTQFLMSLPNTSEYFNNLFLLPGSGSSLYVWRGSWILKYSEKLSDLEKKKIMTAFDAALIEGGYEKPIRTYGPVIEDRVSQITFSGLGQQAPIAEKGLWDPTRQKREKIVAALSKRLSGFDIRIGGATSIDITRRGVNKAYGIRKLEEFLKIQADRILFVGDKLMLGGNDYPVKATGIDCIQVSGPTEVKKLIQSWIG